VFLLKRGLLEHILFSIIDSGCTSRDVLQSYFDLLGELMKFNIDAFKRFNKYVNTEEKVRSVDRAEGLGSRLQTTEKQGERLRDAFKNKDISKRLINVINVQILTQENVSCLNTSLVVLMLARRRDKLAFCLNALREEEYAEKYPGCLLNNLHNLLCFYPCISFTYWKETVSVLLDSDSTSLCAIARYIEAYMDLGKDFLEV
uniref:Uncharacterized protein n=1 Tax=Oncorhynchus mykiss TaxID=8022 RepID=A0A8C7NQC6_ONCMY